MRFEKTTTHIDWRIFNRIVEMFLNLEKSETGILEQVDQMAMDSKDVPLGMILLSICWCARIQIRILKGNDEDEVENDHDLEEEDEKNKTIDEWDAISPEAEHLDCIIMCLHCVSLAQSLLKDDSNILRISDVVPRIDSYIRENVSSKN